MYRCLLIISLLFSNFVFAQQPIHVVYYNKAKLEISSPDTANYSRYYFKDSTDLTNSRYAIKEFYSSGKQKMIGSSFFKDSREYYDGQFNYYDEAGTLREITNFKGGYKLGKSYHFYPNRKLMKEVVYEYNTQHDISLKILEGQGLYHESIFAKGRLVEYLDSVGNILVTAGNGYIKQHVNYLGENFVEEGRYVNGLKSGEWKILSLRSQKVYLEEYNDGSLKNGVFLKNGKKEKYRYVLISPKVGDLRFTTTYLQEAKSSGAVGYFQKSYFAYPNKRILDKDSGITVRADFNLLIDKNGRLVDVEFITLLPKEISERLKKELMHNKGFSAGFYRGEPLQMKRPYWLTICYDKKLNLYK